MSKVLLSCGSERSNLLTSALVEWRDERLWNFSLLQGVLLFILGDPYEGDKRRDTAYFKSAPSDVLLT